MEVDHSCGRSPISIWFTSRVQALWHYAPTAFIPIELEEGEKMSRTTLTAPMKRMLLQFADGVELDALSENGAGWNFTMWALRRRNLLKFIPNEPGGNTGTFVISEEGKAEASRIHAVNARKSQTT